MARVLFEGVKKIYPDGYEALSDFNLDVFDGEFLVLVGPSGCGKSTALRTVAGLEDVTAGEIFIGDRAVKTLAPRDRDISMVFQNYALYPHMTVRQNIGFGLRVRNYNKDEMARKVEDTARILELSPFLDKKPAKLSGGQRQRVAMGRAIARTPQAFLMDEPLSNLDAKLRGLMRAEIKAIQALTGITTIYVTHDQVEAMTMGNRVAVMKAGKIQQLGPPKELYKNPSNMFVASFLGAPSMNMVKCSLEQKSDILFANYGDKTMPLNAELASRLSSYNLRSVVIGIRPEHLSLAGENVGISAGDDNVTITGQVLLVEELGSSNLVHLNADISGDAGVEDSQGQTSSVLKHADILAVLNDDYVPKSEQDISLFSENYNVHLFNSETGQAI